MSASSPRDSLEGLSTAEARFSLFENSTASCIVTRLDGSFLLVNDAFCNFLGYSRDELLQRSSADITHPDDNELTRQFVERLQRGEDCPHLEKRYLTKTGDVVYGLVSVSVLRDAHGEPHGFFGLVQDITEHKLAQHKLAQSEQRYKSLFEFNYDAVFSLDVEGYFLTANPAAQRVSGYTEAELCSMSYVPLLAPEELSRIHTAFRKTVRGEPQNLEATIIRKDGGRVLLDLTAIPIVVEGRVEGVYGVAHDVTRRRSAERSLQDSDERYRLFIQNSSEAIWRYELELPIPVDRSEEEQIEHFYRYAYLAECNDVMARLYGAQSAGEMIGTRLGEVLPRDNVDNMEYLRGFIRSGYRVSDAESQEVDRNGTRKYFLNNLIGIVNNGLLQRAWGTQRDITDRRRADELQKFLVGASSVLASSLDYQTTLRNVARLAVPFFADWCVVDIALEDTVERLAIAHSDPEKEALAEEMRRRYPYNADIDVGVTRVLRTGQSEIYTEIPDILLEQSARDADHLAMLRAVGLTSFICVPLPGRRETVGAISFVSAESGYRYTASDLALAEDIGRRAAVAIENAHLYHEAESARAAADAARVQAELARAEAEAANRSKDEFLAVVSHELRTPLTPILGWLHLLRTSRLNAAQSQQALEAIERSARVQVQLVNDLLDVSRIISGKMRLDIASVNVETVVHEAASAVGAAANSKDIRLHVTASDAGALMCDADRLQQIVWNLLSNAIKFTPEGGRVELQVERHEPQLIIRVQDSGIGIEPEFLPHVFERFRQADSATTRRHGGLGLGLAIVRHLVEMHGGRIEAHSAGIGQGATFSVHLPLRPEHSADTGQGASQGTEAHAAAAPVTRETLPGDEHGGSGEPSPRMESRTGTQPEETGAARPAGAQLFTDVGCVETPDVGAIPAPFSPDALANVRVLLVDDERDARDMVAAVLAQSGAVVTQAASVAEALLRLGRETPQILISDISMPDEDGYMLIRRVRAAGLGGHEMPAIALTARAREQDRQTALDCGFSEHLSKPVHPDTLVSVTARLAGAATSTHSGTTGSHSVAE